MIGIAGPPHSGGFANHQLYRHRALRGVGEPWRYFASNTRVIRRQGNNWLTIAAPPAVRIAHLRTRAKRRFGSSLSTATNKNAPAKQIAKTYRRTITAIKSGNLALSGQDLLAADAIILGCPDSFPSIRQLIDAAGPIVYLGRAGGFPRNARLPQPVYFLASCGTGEASGTNM